MKKVIQTQNAPAPIGAYNQAILSGNTLYTSGQIAIDPHSSIFISNMNDFANINEIYAQYFDEATAPARETVEVANLPKYVNVEISVIAVK